MATTCFGSIRAKVIRVVRLDDCGAPIIGAKSVVVSNGFVKIDVAMEYDDGEEIVVKNAWNDFCINEQDKPKLKRVGLGIDFCKVDPDLVEIVTGARLLLDGANAVGVAFGEDPPDGRFSLEAWTKIPGTGSCTAIQYGYFAWPNIGSGKHGNITLDKGAATFPLSGQSSGANVGWGNSPGGLASYLPGTEVILAGEHMAMNPTSVAPPAATCGAVALAA